MHASDRLTTADILAAFTSEIADHGGNVTSTYRDSTRLFTRSVLPRMLEVQPGDSHHSGVALKARRDQVSVHPYIFREVCRNGAIWAHSLESQLLVDLDPSEPAAAEYVVREAVRLCAAEDVFTDIVDEIRAACFAEADIDLSTLSHELPMAPRMAAEVFREIIDRFFDGMDESRFGLMNAITSLARDTDDPDLRWNLEELGGAVPAPRPIPARPAAASRRPVTTV